MKKLPFIFLVLLTLNAFSQNNERPLAADSPVYSWLTWLYVQEGKTLPSRTGLYTENEARYYLGLIDRTHLPPEAQRVWENLDRELKVRNVFIKQNLDGGKNGLAVAAEQEFNLELYGAVGGDTWTYDYWKRPPLYKINFESWVLDNFYGAFDLEIKKDPFAVIDQKQPLSNLPLSFGEADMQWPYWAGFVTGGDHWDLRFFRSPVRWGAGDWNFILSPDAGSLDHLMFSTWWENFKYSFFWAPEDKYTTGTSSGYGYYNTVEQRSENVAPKTTHNLVIHRIDFRLFEKLSVGISEILIFDYTTFDPQYFNPFLPGHNFYLQCNANSDVALDLEWAVTPGWSLYGQWYGDYIKTSFKNDTFDDPAPAAYGYELGSRTVFTLADGLATFQVEGAYADPFLYINPHCNNVNYWRYQSDYNGSDGLASRVIDRPYGFTQGPDTLVAELKFRWEKPEILALEVSTPFVAKGENSIRTAAPSGYHYDSTSGTYVINNSTPSSYMNLRTPSGTAELAQHLVIQAELGPDTLKFPWDSSLTFRLDNAFIWNKNHVLGATGFDLQSALTWKNRF